MPFINPSILDGPYSGNLNADKLVKIFVFQDFSSTEVKFQLLT